MTSYVLEGPGGIAGLKQSPSATTSKLFIFKGGVNFPTGTIDFTGATITGLSAGVESIVAANANAFIVGATLARPALNVDTSTASQVAGLNVKGAATGGTVALSAIDSGAATNLSIDAKGAGTVLIGDTSTGQVSAGRGAAKPILQSTTATGLGTAQNSAPTAAQIVGGLLTQTGATGAGTVTLDNGTNISAAVPGVVVGDTFQCVFANLGGSQTLTITSASGATVVGNGAVASGTNAIMTFRNTGTNTWNVYVVVSA